MVSELYLTKVILKRTHTALKLNPSMKLNLQEQRKWNDILKIKYTNMKKKEEEKEEKRKDMKW